MLEKLINYASIYHQFKMASIRVSSSNVASSKASSKQEQEQEQERPEFALADATLVDLVEQYNTLYANIRASGEKNPTQATYAKTVSDGLARLSWSAALHKISRLVSVASASFAPSTVESRFSSIQHVVKGEFDPEYHVSIRELYWTEFDDLTMGQLIKAMRVVISEMVYRFFKTYDLNEKRFDRESQKEVLVCLPENATFRRGDRVVSDDDFVSFMTDLLDAYKAVLAVDFEALRTLFRDAGAAAKKARDEFFAKTATEKAQQKRDSRTKAGISKPAPVGQLKIVAVKSNGAVLTPPAPAHNPWAERKATAEAAEAAEAEAVEAEAVEAESAEAEAVEAESADFTTVKRFRGRGRGRGSRVMAPAQQ